MAHIRVLVVDDSAFIRRIVADALSGQQDMEVVGTARDGRAALDILESCKPDIVTLDVEMPGMDGIATLREIRKTHPKLPVIMFSRLTERGAAATIDALALGASDYVYKPSDTSSVALATQNIMADLLPRIRSLAPRAGVVPRATTLLPMRPTATPAAPRAPALQPSGRVRTLEVLAIGASTGGPDALAQVMSALPANLAVPVLIVQHMPPMFTALLARRLSEAGRIPVKEGAEGDVLQPGRAYLAPGDFHMAVERTGLSVRIRLNQRAPENSCRPAVDVLFRSVAETYAAGTLGVVLTGMGRDGFVGCGAIHARGGRILVQDEATSVVWGMPSFVAHAGLAEAILPLPQIGSEILRRLTESWARAPRASRGSAGEA